MALTTAREKGFSKLMQRRFDLGVVNNQVFWPQIATRIPSDSDLENYFAIGAKPGVREWLGERVLKEFRAGDYVLKNKLWESSLLADRHAVDDDKVGVYLNQAEELGAEAAAHPDQLVIDTLVAGATAGNNSFDGVSFFNAAHVWGDSGSQTNVRAVVPAAGAGNAIVAADFKSAYNLARVQMLKFKNDQGKFMNRTATRQDDLLCLIPPDLDQQAREALLTTTYGFSTADAGISPDQGGNQNVVIADPSVVPVTLLTNARKWYLIRRNAPLKGLIFQDRSPLRREVVGRDSIEKKDYMMYTEARYNVGYGAWWTVIEVTFS